MLSRLLLKRIFFDIWCYIAEDNEAAADRVEQAIYDACAFVAEAPLRGHSRPDLTTRSLRFWTLTRYPNYDRCLSARDGTGFKSSRFCMEREMCGVS